MSSYQIRPASSQDSGGAAAVVQAVFEEYAFSWEPEGYHWDLYHLEEAYAQKGHSFWVAELDGRIVGTVALERFAQVPGEPGQLVQVATPAGSGLPPTQWRIGGSDCALERLYVHPDARRMGLGRALFLTTIAQAREEGLFQMEIWSDKKFGDAHRLYQREGAAVVGDRICHDPDQSPEWGLKLVL